MDDQSSEIRFWAVKVIPLLEIKDASDDDKQIFEMFIVKAISMLFLHMDGPEVRINEPIQKSLTALFGKWPDIFKRCYEKSMLTKNSNEIVLKIMNDS